MREDLTRCVVRIRGRASGGGAGGVVLSTPSMLPAEVSGYEPVVLGSRAEPGAGPALGLAVITPNPQNKSTALREPVRSLQRKGSLAL